MGALTLVAVVIVCATVLGVALLALRALVLVHGERHAARERWQGEDARALREMQERVEKLDKLVRDAAAAVGRPVRR